MRFPRLSGPGPRTCPSFLLALIHAYSSSAAGRLFHALAVGVLPAAFLLVTTRDEIYNILWALVFGFATLNILSLGARRLDSHGTGLNFGELLAILIVVVAIILLGWEMLYLFNILPLKLTPR